MPAVLFRDVRVFDGRTPRLTAGNVLVEGNTIAAVSPQEIPACDGVTVIDGGGRTLAPGLIDLHTHPLQDLPWRMLRSAGPWMLGMALAKTLEMYLRHGFTTIREAGGGCTGDVARACDRGIVAGPRLYPSGQWLTQTSGHADHRAMSERHPRLHGCCGDLSLGGTSYLVDSPDDVRRAARENLRQGATQIKIMAGGGVASPSDPLHVTQFRPEEIRAAVEVADDWGTYVTAHLYHDRSALRCIENGVRCIEHGHLLSEETVRLCGERGVPIVTQAVTYVVMTEQAERMGLAETNVRKNREIVERLGRLFEQIKAHGVKTGFSTDLIAGEQHQVNREFTLRKPYFTGAEILRQATSESAEILRMCGPLNPYGNLGEIREGWLADLILVDGDPLEDIALLQDHERCIVLVMKDGVIFKNAL
jgi:imidazolonepropionase-like amidohydrolase